MPDPRLPGRAFARPVGAFARLGFVVAIAAVLFAPHLARASGRGWQEPARREAGIVGNSDVIAEASRWIGQGNVTGKPGAWCAWFASFVLMRTGHKPLPNGLASSALSYGRRVRDPRPGDLAVMSHHVTFFAGWDGQRDFLGLGGNQGRRRARQPLRAPRGDRVREADVSLPDAILWSLLLLAVAWPTYRIFKLCKG